MRGKSYTHMFGMLSSANHNTNKLLHQISSHIAYREDLKGQEIYIKIKYIKNRRVVIQISPDIFCFPSIHDRKRTDRQSLVEHVVKYHDIRDPLVEGSYVYTYKPGNRTRCWIKLR